MKVKIFTFGCFANKDNTEIIKSILEKNNYNITEDEDADIFIINSCIVKHTTENKIISLIKRLRKEYPKNKIVLTGCMPNVEYEKIKDFGIILVNLFNLDNIVNAIEDNNNYLDKRKNIKLGYKIKNKKIIQIAEGCVSNCYYCQTKLAKGNLHSYLEELIIKEIKKSIKENKIIYITATDCGCYGFDIKTNLPNLLKQIISIEGNFKIRIGMINPEHLLKYLEDLIEIYKNNKIIKFLHIPVQSGSDKVLKDMNRNYKINDFKKIIKKFRKEIPRINISTDIIVGYPTETESDFKDTIKLIKEINPEVLNISKFSSRKGTKASELKQLKSEIIKKRSSLLTKLYKTKLNQ